MEKYVNKLFKSSTDLSGLTHRIIREKYLAHVGQEECSADMKAKLKTIVEKKMMERMVEVVAADWKQTDSSSKKKRKKTVETSGSDEEYKYPSKTDSLASKDSAEKASEPSRDSSDFEERSPVKKKVRRPVKRKWSSTDESDFEQETVEKVQKKKSRDLPQQKTKKRKTVTPRKSDNSESDSEVGGMKGKREKRFSGDGKKERSSGMDSEADESEKRKGEVARKGHPKQIEMKSMDFDGLDSEESDGEERLAIVTDSEADDGKIAEKMIKRKCSDSASKNSGAKITGSDENSSDNDAAVNGSTVKTPQSKVKKSKIKTPDVPRSEVKKKMNLKAVISDSSEADSEVEKAQTEKQKCGLGKRHKLMLLIRKSESEKFGKDESKSPVKRCKIKAQKKRPIAVASDSDETDKNDQLNMSNSGQSDVGEMREKVRKGSDDSVEEITGDSDGDSDAVAIRKRPVKKSGKNMKTEHRFVDSDTDSETEPARHVNTAKETSTSKRQKAGAQEKKPKLKMASHKSTHSQNIKKVNVFKKSKKRSVSSSNDSESDDDAEASTKKSAAKGRCLEVEKKELAFRKKKPSGGKGCVDTSQSDESSSEEDEPLVTLKKEMAAGDVKQSSDDSDGGRSSSDDSHCGASHKNKQKKENTKDTKSSKPGSMSKKVTTLKAILRACNSMPVGKNYGIIFRECHTDAEFVKKLKRLLTDAGMTGRPSMKKAKNIRLKKELAELDTGNIISSKGSNTFLFVFSVKHLQ
ncbi:hypothetical protein LSAT2_015150 [Lamellibrachia satsuma]|nr:hypothetical protein LSAT2_015150 [Lamellibrachia satsuma]